MVAGACVIFFLGACASATPPGTQTILLVKGGYGVGANLLSRSSRTALVSSIAPVFAAHNTEVSSLLAATKTTSKLTQELQEAVRFAAYDEDERRAYHSQVTQLSKQVAVEKRSLQDMAKVKSKNAALDKEVAQLTHELNEEKALEEHEVKKDKALSSKVAELGRDLIVTNKAWKEAAMASRAKANALEEVVESSSSSSNGRSIRDTVGAKPIPKKTLAESSAKSAAKPLPKLESRMAAAKPVAKAASKTAPRVVPSPKTVATAAKKPFAQAKPASKPSPNLEGKRAAAKPVVQEERAEKPTAVTAMTKKVAAKTAVKEDSIAAEDQAEAEVDAEDDDEHDDSDGQTQMAAKDAEEGSENASETDADVMEESSNEETDSDTDNF